MLDTAAGVWLDKHGLVTSSHSSNEQTEDPSLELMHRCRHATSSVGSCVYGYGGLRGGKSSHFYIITFQSQRFLVHRADNNKFICFLCCRSLVR